MEKSEDTRDLKVNFTPEEIVNKDFKQKYRGYDSAEVDPFLDQVIQDYEAFIARIKTLETDNKRLVKKVDELSQQDTTTVAPVVDTTPAPATSAAQNTTNYDILRRLSNLERHVFGEQEAARIAPKPTAPKNSSYSNNNTNSGLKSAYDDQSDSTTDSDSTTKKSSESTWLNRF